MSRSGNIDAGQGLLLARAFLAERSLEAAEAAYNEAQQGGADPDECSSGRWQISMLRGDMESAWLESDAIRRRERNDVHRFWDGTDPTERTVMVRCLHGYGDTIQMIQYLPLLCGKAKRVVLEVPPRLMKLIADLEISANDHFELITWQEGLPRKEPPWNMQIEVMELPYLFRTQISDLPILSSYLRFKSEAVQRASAIMGQGRLQRIGLVWTAGAWNQHRALPFKFLRPLLRHSAEFWNLVEQTSPYEKSQTDMPDQLLDATKIGTGIHSLAALICNLDLVITTDTLAAHLAGAAGVPVWMMIPFVGDWRWMDLRTTSPWYPSMRIFRQSSPGDWANVLLSVDHALGELLG